MSQATLAERVERSEAALSRWEGGKATPSAFDIRRIADTVTEEMRKRPDLDLPATLDLASVLLYPPAVYTDPVIVEVFDRIQTHLAESATRPRPFVPTASEAALADLVTRSGVEEGLRRDRSRKPADPGKPAPSRKRSVRAR